MSKVLDLGKLVDVHPGLGILPPLNFAAFGNGDSLNGDDHNGDSHNGDSHNGDDHNGNSHTTNDLTLPVIDDKTVAEKAVKDAQDTPSIWFVNFPNTSALGQKKLLGKYMQNVTDYRSWASLVWWKTVFSEKGVPQDGSTASAAARSAYCAKVAAHHMKLTPWLAMSIDHNISKTIECKTTEFHTELITNVLDGFVGLTPNVFGALEGILKSLSKSSSQTAKTAETKTIVCERYEYIPKPI